MAERAAVQVQNVAVGYGERIVLRNVSFEIREGEIVALLGGSGCGKSTMLKAVIGLLPVREGEILIENESIVRATGERKRSIMRRFGVAFQGGALFRSYTIGENIALPLTISRVPAKETLARVTEVAGRLGIRETLDKYPYQLSGGQQQRVAAARALGTNPAIIMADEPTGALDSKNARLLLESFETMNRTYRATVLMVTHDSFAASYTQRVLFIRDGRIFTELRRGGSTRQEFFDRIMEVVAMMGGEGSDAL